MQQDNDFLQDSVRAMNQMLMELEAQEWAGANLHERSAEQKTLRNGYRRRVCKIREGKINLRIPKLRTVNNFPGLLEKRKKTKQALLSIVQLAKMKGSSSQIMEDFLPAMGLTKIDKMDAPGSAMVYKKW